MCIRDSSTTVKKSGEKLTISDKIDRIVTNRILGIPIFIAIMFVVYSISVTTIGTLVAVYKRQVLDGMEPARRNARWYYYSAAANQGLGNNVTAMEHAKQAVSMEPDNYEYQMLLQQLQGNGSWYQQRQST